MSTTIEDIYMDEFYSNQAQEEEFEERLEKEKLNNFKQYFLTNKEVYKDVIATKKVAGDLQQSGFLSPAFIYYSICIEQIVKNLLVYPIICGSILDEDIALIVKDKVLKGNTVARIDKLTISFMREFGDFDLEKNKTSKGQTIWSEILRLRELRNTDLAHAGKDCSEEEVQAILEIVNLLLAKPVFAMLKKLNLKLNTEQIIVTR